MPRRGPRPRRERRTGCAELSADLSVRVPDGGAADDLGRQEEGARHPIDKLELLAVLLPEVGPVGADEVAAG